MSDFFYIAAICLAFCCGSAFGAHTQDRVWRKKANGPARMLSGGRFYQVLTSEAYEELIKDAR